MARLDHIDGVRVFEIPKFGDHRGFFSETYNAAKFNEKYGINDAFVQDNQSLSATPDTVRGLHFQKPPFAQAKLVRVLRGKILDVAVDIRQASPTFGDHIAAVVSAEQWNQIYIPVGFAHGFATLVPDTEVCYKVSAPYAPDHEAGVMWNDPMLGIDWQLTGDAVLSEKDTKYPVLADLGNVGF